MSGAHSERKNDNTEEKSIERDENLRIFMKIEYNSKWEI